MNERGASPVIGGVIMISFTILLASIFATGATQFVDFDTEKRQIDRLTNGTDTPTPTQILEPIGDTGDEAGTSGNDILEFTIESTGSEQVTVAQFEADATGIDSGTAVNDSDAPEFGVQRVDQNHTASSDGDSDDSSTDGIRYVILEYSTEDADSQYTLIGADVDDAVVDIEGFSQDLGALALADVAEDADLIVTLVLSDGSEQAFYFEEQ